MSNESALIGIGTIYLAGLILAPFPYWRSYFLLWKSVFVGPWNWGTSRKQATFLIRAGLSAPLWTILWYLDELLYPGYRRRSVEPVFIVGQPRCGTTLLHRTLAEDESNFFAVRHVEWRYPFIIVQKLIQALRLDRILEQLNYWPRTEEGNTAAKMHPNTLSDWEEDGIFFEEIFLHHFFIFLRFPQPELLPYLNSFPELPNRIQHNMLHVHRAVIKKVQYLRGEKARFYLSKEVTSHNKITSLMEIYPKARFIVITRKANEFMASLLALVRTSTKVKTGIDPLYIRHWEEALIQRMREDSKRLVHMCESAITYDRQVRISSKYFTEHIVNTVKEIYKQLKLSMSKEFLTRLEILDNDAKTRDRGYDYEQLNPRGFEEYDRLVERVVTECETCVAIPAKRAASSNEDNL